jgi:hypothetical protein
MPFLKPQQLQLWDGAVEGLKISKDNSDDGTFKIENGNNNIKLRNVLLDDNYRNDSDQPVLLKDRLQYIENFLNLSDAGTLANFQTVKNYIDSLDPNDTNYEIKLSEYLATAEESIQANESAVSTEASARVSADSSLETSLDTRISVEEDTRSDAVSTEASARVSADSSLETSLDTRISVEEDTRAYVDSKLQAIIINEITRATDAEISIAGDLAANVAAIHGNLSMINDVLINAFEIDLGDTTDSNNTGTWATGFVSPPDLLPPSPQIYAYQDFIDINNDTNTTIALQLGDSFVVSGNETEDPLNLDGDTNSQPASGIYTLAGVDTNTGLQTFNQTG